MTESRPERRSGILQPTDVGSYSQAAINRLRETVLSRYREHDQFWKQQDDSRYNNVYCILNHCVRVGKVAGEVARQLGLFSEAEIVLVEIAGLLHDISKVNDSCKAYRETRRWSPEERHAFEEMHQYISQQEVFELSKGMRDEDRYFMTTIALVVGNHHSWYRPSIPHLRLKCLIVSLSDSFVTMQEDRGYQLGLSQFQAVEKLRSDITEMLVDERFRAYANELEACRRALAEFYGVGNVIPNS